MADRPLFHTRHIRREILRLRLAARAAQLRANALALEQSLDQDDVPTIDSTTAGNHGAVGNGASGNGARGNGASGNGASGNGASGNGVVGNRATPTIDIGIPASVDRPRSDATSPAIGALSPAIGAAVPSFKPVSGPIAAVGPSERPDAIDQITSQAVPPPRQKAQVAAQTAPSDKPKASSQAKSPSPSPTQTDGQSLQAKSLHAKPLHAKPLQRVSVAGSPSAPSVASQRIEAVPASHVAEGPVVVVQKSRRLKASIVSASIHFAAIALLAAYVLPAATPPQGLTLTATMESSVTEVAASLETTPLETPEPLETMDQRAPTVIESEPMPTAKQVSQEAMMAAPKLVIGSGLQAIPTNSLAALGASEGHGASGLLAEVGQGNAGAEFFGLRGEGNHFAWVVDCSNSMRGKRFQTAVEELIKSVEGLKPQQRFFVVFYAQDTFPMQLDAQGPATRSSLATDEAKWNLRQWALRQSTHPGGPPDQALQVALKRRPDAIFLLTDGLFPDRVESFLEKENVVETAFEDPKPRATIHTIGFDSRDGESRLRRIAHRHRGQYTFVPLRNERKPRP
jgi:hypothetical protein